jgi:hypothetical protein
MSDSALDDYEISTSRKVNNASKMSSVTPKHSVAAPETKPQTMALQVKKENGPLVAVTRDAYLKKILEK